MNLHKNQSNILEYVTALCGGDYYVVEIIRIYKNKESLNAII